MQISYSLTWMPVHGIDAIPYSTYGPTAEAAHVSTPSCAELRFYASTTEVQHLQAMSINCASSLITTTMNKQGIP